MKFLFLCVANSARSQMAEGLAKTIFGNSHVIESAGSVPAKVVNPYAVKVLSEKGIDISAHRPKIWNDLPKEFLGSLDYVITLCAEETCPVFSSKAKKLHWPLPDPANAKGERENLTAFRAIRDEIKKRLEAFKNQL